MNQPFTAIWRRADGFGHSCELANTDSNAQVLARIAERVTTLHRGLHELRARNVIAADHRECELRIETGYGMPAAAKRFHVVVFDLSINAPPSVVLCAGVERGASETLCLYALDVGRLASMTRNASAVPC